MKHPLLNKLGFSSRNRNHYSRYFRHMGLIWDLDTYKDTSRAGGVEIRNHHLLVSKSHRDLVV